MCMCVYTLLVIWMAKTTFVIKKVIEVEHYFKVEASSLNGAIRIAKRREAEGNLSGLEATCEQDTNVVVCIEVAKEWNSGQPVGESKIVQ